MKGFKNAMQTVWHRLSQGPWVLHARHPCIRRSERPPTDAALYEVLERQAE
jgi:hypothetical protein